MLPVRKWYGSEPLGKGWMRPAVPKEAGASAHADALADALERQSVEFGAGAKALENISKLRAGARAVVTGQQVGLLGGPLYVLHEGGDRDCTGQAGVGGDRRSGAYVPVFWLATEDHDLEEVDQVSLLTKTEVETLRLGLRSQEEPVGSVVLGEGVDALLERASELLGFAPVCDLLRECYRPDGTFGGAFARLMARLFADEGLIVMDAAGREFHALGARALRAAIEDAEGLEAALLARAVELEAAGYHAQVLVKAGASLLFLVGEDGRRQALRRGADGVWKAGAGATAASYTTAELLGILEATPERLSPNALLRPVFQDTILPVTAYVGGPAEVAYFAQSAVLYERVLGRVTPVLPRLSASLIEPEIGAVMAQHEVTLPDVMRPAEELAQRLGVRAMPIDAKRKLAAAGNALDDALTAAQDYLGTLDAGAGEVGGGLGFEDEVSDEPAAAAGGHGRAAEGRQPEETC